MKKVNKSDLLISVVAVALAFIIFFQVYSVTNVKLITQTAQTTTVYETISTSALVIRDETVIENSSSGVIVPCLSDGDKAKVNSNVAMIFKDSDSANNYDKYSEIQQEIEYYTSLESQSVGQITNVDSINDQIYDNIDEYIRLINSNDLSNVSDYAGSVNDSIIRRQILIGESVDLTSVIQELRQESETYASNLTPSSYITTENSGIYSSYTDGFESIIDFSTVEELTIDEVNSAIETVNTTDAQSVSSVGKLVTSYTWYFVCVVDAESVASLDDGDKIDVVLDDNYDMVLTMKIVSGAEPDLNQDQTVLILKSTALNSSTVNFRLEDIKIRLNEYTGIKVPSSAVHVIENEDYDEMDVDEDGNPTESKYIKGVYVLISSQVKFREATILYSQDDYVIMSYKTSDSDGIHLYDKIITQGKDLEDGKVYT